MNILNLDSKERVGVKRKDRICFGLEATGISEILLS